MKRLAVLVAAAAVVGLAVDILSDATQTRPDNDHPESRTELVFHVRSKNGPVRAAAEGLWGACQGTAQRKVLPPGMTEIGEGKYRLVLQPALGRHARDRMTGCLEDVTIDNVKGNVVSMTAVAPER